MGMTRKQKNGKVWVMDVKKVLETMSLEEKARLVNGASFFGTAQIDRLGIPRIQLLDGGTGINFEQLFGDMVKEGKHGADSTNEMVGSTVLTHVIDSYFEPEKLTKEELRLHAWISEQLEKKLDGMKYAPSCFPPGILLGATWNKEVVGQVGEALGKEAKLYGIQILLGTPNVNIHRDPLNGRLFEGYSEDPCLVSKLAPELVKGVQKYGVAANVKHFAANNQETNRVGVNETISLRALEEIYFPGFKACVQVGNVKTVMSAYNRINKIPCTENKWLLTEKLRKEWGFDGVVMSDWGAVYHPVEALAAGNDLAMPGPIAWEPIAEAVQSGALKEDELNLAVERLLSLIDWISQNFKHDVLTEKTIEQLRIETNRVAYRAASEGAVLLENAGILPFSEDTQTFVVGSGADRLLECGSGSAGITTNRTTSFIQNLKQSQEKEADIIVCVCKLGGMEGNDRPHMHLVKEDLEILYSYGAIDYESAPQIVRAQLAEMTRLEVKRKQKDLVLILNVCGPVDLSYINKDVVKAVLVSFLPGMEGGKAIADILVGKVNPSGKLPLTFPVKYEDTPTYLNFPGDGYEVCYGEGIYVGYRYYEKKKIKPLYPFGFGMSYTTFAYEGLKQMSVRSDKITFTVLIKNTGDRFGAQVVQIYVGDPYATLQKPVKELVAFEKVYLEAGEQKAVKFEISTEQLASYDADLKQWTVEEGYYDIYAATSSNMDDVFAKERVYVHTESPYSFGLGSTVKTMYEHVDLKQAIRKLWLQKKWDWGIVENNYQYTSNRTIYEIMPKEEKWKAEDDALVNEFLMTVKKIKKQ